MGSRSWCLLALFVVMTGFAEPQIRVEGLFPGAAYFNINGQQVLLKQGNTHDSGLHLIEATSRQAVVEIDGKRHQLTLNMAIGGAYQQTELSQISIRKNDNNQYFVNGSIHSMPVTFLVDTGANIVAMNSHQARKLGIQYQSEGQPSQAATASGVVNTWLITLDTIKVGEISVQNVRAAVLEGNYPSEVLLGMSFLEHVKIQEKNSVLLLEQRF